MRIRAAGKHVHSSTATVTLAAKNRLSALSIVTITVHNVLQLGQCPDMLSYLKRADMFSNFKMHQGCEKALTA